MMEKERAARRETVRAFKRRHILDAARGLFEEKGANALNMREIAAAAGYSLGALYLHFRTKEEIEDGLLADLLSGLARRLRGSGKESPESAVDGFRLFFRHFAANEADRMLYLAGFLRKDEGEVERKLHGAMGALANRLHQSNLFSPGQAQEETINALATINGALLLNDGRDARMGARAEEIVDRCLERMLLRGKEQKE